ncbi:MAG: hypothetical protein OHK0032_00850 [Thermodesulfovibrionales bacterium]
MAFFNYATREITLKVVYYGPGLSGKTTNLQYLYSTLEPAFKGKFISLSTEADRTLFFDFLPVELGKIKDFSLRFQLYTVPGQIRYNATRRLVLKGADAIVFVADSQKEMREQNIESLSNMSENLLANNLDPDGIPIVLQYNKRDLHNILSIEDLNRDLNEKNYQYIEAEAVNGKGVQETFRAITKTLLKGIAQKHKVDTSAVRDEAIAVKIPEKGSLAVEEVLSASQAVEEEEIVQAVLPSTPEATPYNGEKLDRMADSLREIVQTLIEIRDNLSDSILKAMKTYSDEVRESRKQQADILKTLERINSSLAKVEEKKRWFRLK